MNVTFVCFLFLQCQMFVYSKKPAEQVVIKVCGAGQRKAAGQLEKCGQSGEGLRLHGGDPNRWC